MSAKFMLSAFGDEAAEDFEEQLKVLTDLDVYGLDLRRAWGINVRHLSDEQVSQVKALCEQYGVKVVCLGSPIGKSPLNDPIDNELVALTRLIEIAKALDCRYIRIFSFYPEDTFTNAHYDQYVAEVVDRLSQLAALAYESNIVLLHENESRIVGDTIARCHALLTGVNSPALRGLWDPSNFVNVGEETPVDNGWSVLGDWTDYIHIKDKSRELDSVVPAGEGDGQIDKLLQKLIAADYQGVLALEPHLLQANHSSGFTGPELMKRAVDALRKVMADVGCEEVRQLPTI